MDTFLVENSEEALSCAITIANNRLQEKCKCENDVGYICDWCKKWHEGNEEEYLRLCDAYHWLVFKSRFKRSNL